MVKGISSFSDLLLIPTFTCVPLGPLSNLTTALLLIPFPATRESSINIILSPRYS
jgi:hypothetical protein